MKTATRTYGLFTILLFALILACTTVTLANDGDKNKQHITELKFIGNVDNHPVFQLNVNNSEEDEFVVTFRDEYGNILYTDKFKGSNITKRFMLKTEDFGD